MKSLDSRQWGQPQGMGKVVEEGVAKGDLILLEDFLTRKTSIYQGKGWIDGVKGMVKVPSLWEMAGWAWSMVGMGQQEGDTPAGKFVLRENLEVGHRSFKLEV
jgi:hypothetical protein